MAARADYIAGFISLTNGSVDFTGTGTGWLAATFREGDTIIDVTGATEFMGVIATIDDNDAGTLTKPWEGPDLVDVLYRMRYHADGARVTAQARELIELLGNGNLQAFAALEGAANLVPMFTAPGALTLVNKSLFVNGIAYDAAVDDMAGRAAYDDRPGPTDDEPGFAVLVRDIGGYPYPMPALFNKESDANADWSDPALLRGEVGEPPDLVNVNVTSVPYTDPAAGSWDETSPGVYDLNLDLPEARGYDHKGTYSGATAYVPDDTVLYNNATWRAKIATTGNAPPVLPTTSNTQWELVAGARGYNDRGAYDNGTAYVIDDTVLDNGSTWRALQSTTGNVPPTLPTTSNAYWTLVARKGTDGAGTGDVVGPAGAVNNRIAVFDGTTGKLIKDGGSGATISDITTAIDGKSSVGLALAAALVLGG